MTNYTFDANFDSTDFPDWDDPASWYGGVVPNSADADVVFPLVTFASSGEVYSSYIQILTGESFLVNSITLTADSLLIHGSLTVTGALNVGANGEVDLYGGSLSIGSYTSAGYDIQGTGQVNCSGDFDNTTAVYGSLTIETGSFHNTGLVGASESSVIKIDVTGVSGGATVYAQGALIGGMYQSLFDRMIWSRVV